MQYWNYPQSHKLDEHKKHAASLIDHIRFVQAAGRALGIPLAQMEIHDESKWSDAEFPAYAKHFHGTRDAKSADEFAAAWLHHIHANPHHWQHWIFPGDYHQKGSSMEGPVVEMPEMYVREMVADWMGAEMAYQKTWDMTKWLNENLGKITLHPNSWTHLRYALEDAGYDISDDLSVSISEKGLLIPGMVQN